MDAVLESPPMAELAQRLDRDKVRALRQKLELTHKQAAEAAGFPGGPSQWSDIEHGYKLNLTLGTLNGVAKALGVDLRELITPLPKPGRPSRRKGKA